METTTLLSDISSVAAGIWRPLNFYLTTFPQSQLVCRDCYTPVWQHFVHATWCGDCVWQDFKNQKRLHNVVTNNGSGRVQLPADGRYNCQHTCVVAAGTGCHRGIWKCSNNCRPTVSIGVVRVCRQGKDMLYIDLLPWFVLIGSVNNHFQCTQISLQLLQSPSTDHTWPASGHCKHSTWSWWVSIWNMHVIHILCVCVCG